MSALADRIESDTLDTMVLIVAGQEKTHFHFHKGLLCKASPYFRAVLEGGFKEAELQTIEWPEEKATIVKVFQVWLYSGSVSLLPEDEAMPWEILVGLYVFADGHDLPALEDSIINYIIRKIVQQKSKVDLLALAPSYDTIRPQAPLRRLIIDLVSLFFLAAKDYPDQRKAWSKCLPRELLEDFVLAQRDMMAMAERRKHPYRFIMDNKANYYSVGSNASMIT